MKETLSKLYKVDNFILIKESMQKWYIEIWNFEDVKAGGGVTGKPLEWGKS